MGSHHHKRREIASGFSAFCLSIAIIFLVQNIIISAFSNTAATIRPNSRLFTSRTTTTMLAAKKNQVIVVGSANQDLTSYTPVLPLLGETVMGNTFATSCGGKGANQAVAAAKLNIVPVSMICRVADDVFGQNLLNNFRKWMRMKYLFGKNRLLGCMELDLYFQNYWPLTKIIIFIPLHCRQCGR